MIPSVVIVIPIYKVQPDELEEKSLRQCLKMLGKYPITFVAPEDLNIQFYEKMTQEYGCPFNGAYFSNIFFKSIEGYNQLLLSKEFYLFFKPFSHMLLYQLDAFVFKDSLMKWIKEGYSNIGGPWLKKTMKGYKFITPTGNGGLVLRNINDCLRVLEKKKFVFTPYWEFILFKDLGYKVCRRYQRFIISQIKMPFQDLGKYILSFPYNEDIFWAKLAPLIDESFVTAPPSKAMKFAFDQHAEVLFKWNNKKLPFGCHGWSKPSYLKFWQPIIEREATKV